jgi:hypothetical protein
MHNNSFKAAVVAITLSLGIGAITPLAAEAAQNPPQCNAVTGCGTILDYIKNLLRS